MWSAWLGIGVVILAIVGLVVGGLPFLAVPLVLAVLAVPVLLGVAKRAKDVRRVERFREEAVPGNGTDPPEGGRDHGTLYEPR